jgi:hypothetical protein
VHKAGIEVDDEQTLEARLTRAELALEQARHNVADLSHSLAKLAARYDAAIGYFEHRVDLIYRRVTGHLAKLLADGNIVVETESAVDLELARLFSAGLRADLDLEHIRIGDILSDTITPGMITAPLTLYGFRLVRDQAQEHGTEIELFNCEGTAVYGPYKRLKPGCYRVTGCFRSSGLEHPGEVEMDVFSPTEAMVIATKRQPVPIGSGPFAISTDIDWPLERAQDMIEFRVHAHQPRGVYLKAFSIEVL